MDPAVIGLLITVVTIGVFALGIPVAFGLGFVAVTFLLLFEGIGMSKVIADTFMEGLMEFTIVSIPMFIVMGMAVASSPAGKDLYSALDRWLNRVPGGLVVSNLGACALFAALSGSSPATCAAIGKMGIPEMRQRGYSKEISSGTIAAGGTLGILIPPSITMIVFGISTETSIGQLFMAGILPGIMLTGLFMMWAIFKTWRTNKDVNQASVLFNKFSWKERFEILPRVLPFLAVVVGVLYVLYGGIATPSEASGIGAFLCIILVAVIYKIYDPKKLWRILKGSMKESVMIMMIIACSYLFSFTLSNLYVTQTIAEVMSSLDVNKWVLLFMINIFLLVAGFFLPPVAIILMTTPILLPIIEGVGFDPIWFAVILTINMEIGLITPPVGLNLYVIKGISPDITLPEILRGSLPFMLCMVLAIIILCIFPQIATWLPNYLLGS
ncbi:TRAP transporter large permease [Candidatus Pelagibacter ubique]|jgi:C4-dicarboxylate transporter DctM subunit|nr:TRAP transporter large permease [Candidatus Pelagibacter ubique]|tara:strand:- start:161 stop:1480 length:1320 start_codon:yes stop_codon:yes gene_type:complete